MLPDGGYDARADPAARFGADLGEPELTFAKNRGIKRFRVSQELIAHTGYENNSGRMKYVQTA